MPLILHIDTAVQSASVCLAKGNSVLDTLINPSEKESAAWLHTAIKTLLERNNYQFQEIQAVAISEGPGSYTGLRVGMSAAKGLCYALSIPLIGINTLQMMAAAVIEPTSGLLCPMIDARRMEVFTAIYTTELEEVMPPAAIILEEKTFDRWLDRDTIHFFGNGSHKATSIISHKNAMFKEVSINASHLVNLSAKRFEKGQFSELAYTEPYYGKDFHSVISKKNY